MNDLLKYVAAAVTVGGLLFGVGRTWGQLEQRILRLEQIDRYQHGDLTPFLKKE